MAALFVAAHIAAHGPLDHYNPKQYETHCLTAID